PRDSQVQHPWIHWVPLQSPVQPDCPSQGGLEADKRLCPRARPGGAGGVQLRGLPAHPLTHVVRHRPLAPRPPGFSADFPYNPGQGQAIRNGVNRNSAIIGGVIAVVIFTILCTLVFLIRYMFRHKGTYHTNEAKGAESAESADAAIMNNDPNFTETIDESKKEWLI
uniref:Neurexin/syndecan/glycophorin C domain-containing protein n=1 Tax=Sus scrofa TaxID=9823 RepID=A0A8D0WI18_PIG